MYTPSYLESIDVSYNEIPILTMEITVGTNKVKHLNLSHNFIDEIRPGTTYLQCAHLSSQYSILFARYFSGVLGNLTSLNVLDLSFNNLETMKNVGNMPVNMSVLWMSNNKLRRLSKEIINFVPNLRDFEVENNQFNNFPAALAKIVAKGPKMSFKGTSIYHTYSV